MDGVLWFETRVHFFQLNFGENKLFVRDEKNHIIKVRNVFVWRRTVRWKPCKQGISPLGTNKCFCFLI